MNLNKPFFTVILCILVGTQFAVAQNKNYFSFELAGSGGFGSINYEKSIYSQPKMSLNLRYGFSFTPIDKSNGVVLIFPIMLHCLVGEKSHKLDIAAGQAFSISTKLRAFITTPLAIGYRYQPLNKNYFLRVSYTPLVSYLFGIQWQNWAGIAYGYHFNRKK